LEGLLPEACVNAIKSINYQHSDYVPSSSLDKSMVATVAFIDLITAVYGSTSLKDIKEVNIDLLKNKLLESNFTNVNLRSRILLCNDVGIDLKDFLEIGINTLREI
jgi:predicted hydrolase (HD superfamily)